MEDESPWTGGLVSNSDKHRARSITYKFTKYSPRRAFDRNGPIK